MAVFKRKNRSGKVVWRYCFDLPGSTKNRRRRALASGFATKKEAIDAEIVRRVEEQQKAEAAAAAAKQVDAPLPKTLADLLGEFFAEHADRRLEAKTVERYKQQAEYLSPELLAMPMEDVTSLHLSREWNRLLESGGHKRTTKEPRPLSAKSVRNIAGVVSSAYSKAVDWRLVQNNPVHGSDIPKVAKRRGMALTPQQQQLAIEAIDAHPYLGVFLEVSAATGARRGEVLALRWADVVGGKVHIMRSLSQTKDGLRYKTTKTGDFRALTLPPSALRSLDRHRKQQEAFRRQFGRDYRVDLDLVFCQLDGSELRPDSVSAAISALFKRLKLPKGVSLHTLRHTHGSHLLAAGMELTAVSERLGHSSPYVTATVYSHMLKGRDEVAAQKWEEFQKREGKLPGKGISQ